MLSFTNKLRSFSLSPKKRVAWQALTIAVLGTSYELSVVFVGDTRMRRVNATYRTKNRPTNVLSFPLSQSTGEILLNIPYIHREASRYKDTHPARHHLDYLFIHGLLHLRGHNHGTAMEHEEQRLMKKYILG